MRSKSCLVYTPHSYFRAEDNEPLVNKQYPRPFFAKQMPNLKLNLKLKINAHGKKKSWNPIRTMRLIILSQPSVFVRADLRAHSFGFILTSPGLVRLVLFGSNTPCIGTFYKGSQPG